MTARSLDKRGVESALAVGLAQRRVEPPLDLGASDLVVGADRFAEFLRIDDLRDREGIDAVLPAVGDLDDLVVRFPQEQAIVDRYDRVGDRQLGIKAGVVDGPIDIAEAQDQCALALVDLEEGE